MILAWSVGLNVAGLKGVSVQLTGARPLAAWIVVPLRQGEWVLIESPKSAHGAAEPAWWKERFGVRKHDQPAELFHLKEDLRETKNLYAQYPERAKEMHALLDKYKTEDRSVPKR